MILFRPVLTFTPDRLPSGDQLTGRERSTLKQGILRIPGMDLIGGSPAPEGVYIWFLKVRTPSGKSIIKNRNHNII